VCRVSMCLYSLYLPSRLFRLMHGKSDYFVKRKKKKEKKIRVPNLNLNLIFVIYLIFNTLI
jgi:hypothetical protein